VSAVPSLDEALLRRLDEIALGADDPAASDKED